MIRHVGVKLSSAQSYATHDYFNAFVKCRNEITELRQEDASDARVLILGCGYHYPDVALWSTVANHAVGADIRAGFLRSGFWTVSHGYRDQGRSLPESVFRTMILKLTYASYYDHLESVSGLELDKRRQDVVKYDGSRLPFPDESFDIVCSNAVLEHVAELKELSKEMRRVTSQSGINYHLWHNYCALSGSHVPDEMAQAYPWGHLLGNPQVDAWLRSSGTYLNRKTHSEISEILDHDFNRLRLNPLDRSHNRKGIDKAFEYEGAELLTDSLETSLSRYSRDELLTRAYSFIGTRKRIEQKPA